MAEQYINILKSKLDEKRSEILKKLNDEYSKLLSQRVEELENIKRNILKEVPK
ncbi:MAG: ATPase [Sulfolobaceae archaeon]